MKPERNTTTTRRCRRASPFPCVLISRRSLRNPTIAPMISVKNGIQVSVRVRKSKCGIELSGNSSPKRDMPMVVMRTLPQTTIPPIRGVLVSPSPWRRLNSSALDGTSAEEFNRLHGDGETKTPRMGGIVVWGSVLITTIGMSLLGELFPESSIPHFDFLTRTETWIPFFTLIIGAMVGFLNDLLDISTQGKGLALRQRLVVVVFLSGFIGWWFYAKLAVV